jgi:nucleoside-diphosphate-sugar epimerase
MSSKPILLVFGYGPRTGKPITDKFVKAGYRVVATGRSLKDGPVNEGFLNVKADLADPSVVSEVFKRAQSYFKAAPNVVVYNGPSSQRPLTALTDNI